MSLLVTQQNPSLLRQVLGWMVGALVILAILGGSYAFWNSYKEISDFQDDNLKNIATLLADSDVTHLNKLNHYQTADNDGGLSIDVISNVPQSTPNANQEKNALDEKRLSTIPQGLSSQEIAGETWQVYRLDKNTTSILVRQRIDLQDDLAETSAVQSVLPLVLAIITLGLLLTYIIWRMFRPVKALAVTIEHRQDFDLSALPLAGLPKEILPFVIAINQLLKRTKSNVEQQQRFIADASHELRSPLTAISLQLQRMQRLTVEPKLQEGLDKLAIRVKRNQDLVEQLLTIARLNTSPDQHTPVLIHPIIDQTINLLLPIIDHKRLQLRLQVDEPFNTLAVKADITALHLLIKNIVQNAVYYTPDNGEVSIVLGKLSDCSPVLLSQSRAIVNHDPSTNLTDLPPNTPILQVIDTGHGIAPESYQQAFEAFVRLTVEPDANSPNRSDSSHDTVKGTGLGLSIVKTVCEQSHINLYLSPSRGTPYNLSKNQGLCVTLVLPNTPL